PLSAISHHCSSFSLFSQKRRAKPEPRSCRGNNIGRYDYDRVHVPFVWLTHSESNCVSDIQWECLANEESEGFASATRLVPKTTTN
ncbi:MAG TPA: hypothetical protein VIF64_14580, partial [Pyrinomonadaceae bacterium]